MSTVDILDAYMKQLFMKGMRDLGDPGDTMYNSHIRKNTDFGQLFHKEGMWSLYKYGDGRSLMYHLCRTYAGYDLVNSPVRPRTGDCSTCGSKSPDEIRGLWTLHNFDWIQSGSDHPDV